MLSSDILKDIGRVDAQLEAARGAGEWLQVAAHEAQLAKLRKDLADARALEKDAAEDLRAQQQADRRKAELKAFDADVLATDKRYAALVARFDAAADAVDGMWREFRQLTQDADELQKRARQLGQPTLGVDRLRIGGPLTGALLAAKRGEGPLKWAKG